MGGRQVSATAMLSLDSPEDGSDNEDEASPPRFVLMLEDISFVHSSSRSRRSSRSRTAQADAVVDALERGALPEVVGRRRLAQRQRWLVKAAGRRDGRDAQQTESLAHRKPAEPHGEADEADQNHAIMGEFGDSAIRQAQLHHQSIF